MKRLIMGGLLLWGLLAASGLHAASYLVEILIFARDDPGASEYLPPDPGIPDYREVPTPDQIGQSLDPAQGRLGVDRQTLSRSGGGTPLLHALWRQPIPAGSRESPTKVRIASSEQIDGEPLAEGVVAVGRGRFLHLHLDLLMRQPGSGERYRLVAQRRMGSNELHYIDHPKMGVLVRIAR